MGKYFKRHFLKLANEYMERYSVSLAIKDINPNHNQAPLHIHQDGQNKKKTETRAGKHAEKPESSQTAGENVKQCSCFENSLAVPQNVQHGVPYDSAVPFLDIYLRELKTHVHTNTCTRMFIAALFIMNQQNVVCPSNAVLF